MMRDLKSSSYESWYLILSSDWTIRLKLSPNLLVNL